MHLRIKFLKVPITVYLRYLLLCKRYLLLCISGLNLKGTCYCVLLEKEMVYVYLLFSGLRSGRFPGETHLILDVLVIHVANLLLRQVRATIFNVRALNYIKVTRYSLSQTNGVIAL